MIGLTGFELIQGSDTVLQISNDNLSCNIGNETLNRLINGKNLTTDKRSMWCIPYDGQSEIVLTLAFESFIYLSGNINLILILCYNLFWLYLRNSCMELQ